MSAPRNPLSLVHWRRTMVELYADVRAGSADPERASDAFRAARDRLFREHEDSPLPRVHRSHWRGASWFPYDAHWRIKGVVKPFANRTTFEIALAADGATRFSRVGTVEFAVSGAEYVLALYWIEGYGGGLWLPFGDSSNGTSTYGGGRYLYDTIKGADLGASADELVLDFNFAYNPSCAYDDRWSCPLPPAENRLPLGVSAGERVVDLEGPKS
jgi:uncharacterized protein (DUF1684 family)